MGFSTEPGSFVNKQTQFFPVISYGETYEGCIATAKKLVTDTVADRNKHFKKSETEAYWIKAEVNFGEVETLHTDLHSMIIEEEK